MRDTLETAARMQNATARAELDAVPDAPAELEYLWAWFLRLDATRHVGMGAASGISEQEFGWFFRNRRIEPMPWEIEILVELDRVAMTHDSQQADG